jgi:hypothetical protein
MKPSPSADPSPAPREAIPRNHPQKPARAATPRNQPQKPAPETRPRNVLLKLFEPKPDTRLQRRRPSIHCDRGSLTFTASASILASPCAVSRGRGVLPVHRNRPRSRGNCLALDGSAGYLALLGPGQPGLHDTASPFPRSVTTDMGLDRLRWILREPGFGANRPRRRHDAQRNRTVAVGFSICRIEQINPEGGVAW